MTVKNQDHTLNNIISHKINQYLLSQNLKDVATELDQLSEEYKKIVIEGADKKDSWVLKGLYDSLYEYMEW